MLFMGEEFAASSPFLFFCDFGPELAQAVSTGRRREFSRFEQFSSKEMQERIPDPNHPDTFERSRLDWLSASDPAHASWLDLYRALLALRAQHLVPRLTGMRGHSGRYTAVADGALVVRWMLGDQSELELRLNLSDAPARVPEAPRGKLLYCEPASSATAIGAGELPANAAAVYLA
jgi:1,4-alpha-glucan branching enzyme